MQLYLSIFFMLALVSSSLFGADQKKAQWTDLPSILQLACREIDRRGYYETWSCDMVQAIMNPRLIREAQDARKAVSWFSYKDSCLDNDLAPRYKDACKNLHDAYQRSLEIEKPIQKIGDRGGLSEEAVTEVLKYCQHKIQGHLPDEKVLKTYPLLVDDKISCWACSVDENASQDMVGWGGIGKAWWPNGQKKQ